MDEGQIDNPFPQRAMTPDIPNRQPDTSNTPEAKPFKPSAVAKDEDELKVIQAISHRGISRTFNSIHKNDPAVYTTDSLRKIFLDIENTLNNEDKEELDNQTSIPMARLTEEITRRAEEDNKRQELQQQAQAKAIEEGMKNAQDASKKEQEEQRKRLEQEQKQKEEARLTLLNDFRGVQRFIQQDPTPATEDAWGRALGYRQRLVVQLLDDHQIDSDQVSSAIRTIIRSGTGDYVDTGTELLRNISLQDTLPATSNISIANDPTGEGVALREVIGVGIYGITRLLTDVLPAEEAERNGGRLPSLDVQRQRNEEREILRQRHGFLADALGIDLNNEIKIANNLRADERKQAEEDKQNRQTKDKKEGDEKKEFPKDYEKQYERVMGMISEVEAQLLPVVKHTSNEAAIIDFKKIQEIRDMIFNPECNAKVRDEAMARLRIHDSFYVIVSAGGLEGQPQTEYLKMAYSEPAREAYAFQPGDASILAQSDFLCVDQAYKVLSDKLRNGVVLPTGVPVNLNRKDLDDSIRRQAQVELCKQIHNNERKRVAILNQKAEANPQNKDFLNEFNKANALLSKMDREIVTLQANIKDDIYVIEKGSVLAKSLELADRIAEVWAEKSVVDEKGVGRGLVWSLSHFDKYRMRPNGDPGPRITIPFIPDLAVSSFPRMVTQKFDNKGNPLPEGSYMLLPNTDPAKVRDEQSFQRDRSLRIRGVDQFGNYVHADLGGINWKLAPKNAWLDYVKNKLPKAFELRDMLTRNTWSTKDLTPDTLDSVSASISKIMTVDSYRIKALLALGWETDSLWKQDSTSRPGDLGWDVNTRDRFNRSLLSHKFLTLEEYQWVMNNRGKDPSKIRTLPQRITI